MKPWQYSEGKIDFFGCELLVTPSALIPRQETEILASLIAEKLEKCDLEGKILWDVCTGSGCLGISLKKRFPKLQVELSDLSPAALELAEENARKNGVEVTLHEGDLFEPFGERVCDFFVSNPPYIREDEFSDLDPSVRDFEPKMALVGGESGLEFYERIARELPLRGWGWLEIGTGQGVNVKEIFEGQGWKCNYKKDWSGHDRFFFLENLSPSGISSSP